MNKLTVHRINIQPYVPEPKSIDISNMIENAIRIYTLFHLMCTTMDLFDSITLGYF